MTMVDKQKVLSLSESELYDFIIQHPEVAHIKSADECKYIVNNTATARVFGLRDPKEIIGLTAKDLDRKFMRKFWGDTYADNIAKLDHHVKTIGDIAHSDHEIFLNGIGQVRVQNLVKFPYKGKNNKITAILTFTEDLTKNLDLFYLWELYKKLSKNMTDAIANFSKYLNLDYNLSTEKEIVTLITLIKSQAYRYKTPS